jgi:hypothetical protein
MMTVASIHAVMLAGTGIEIQRKVIVMKALIASIFALGLLATTADAAGVGVRVGPIGIRVGHYHHGNHWYGHRHWERDHYRYW